MKTTTRGPPRGSCPRGTGRRRASMEGGRTTSAGKSNGLSRSTHHVHVVSKVLLTSKLKLHFSLDYLLKRNLYFDINRTLRTTWCVTLYKGRHLPVLNEIYFGTQIPSFLPSALAFYSITRKSTGFDRSLNPGMRERALKRFPTTLEMNFCYTTCDWKLSEGER